ncbi:MAG: hypothetical protein K0R81_571 [Microbacterium sp.]|jgi:hypothetical protein|nr:hypothetical protein [Microbacterium sp.]
MHWDWGVANQVVDDVIITVGIAVLIVRQFIWRSTQLHRMLRLPVAIIAAGLVYLVIELWGGLRWVPADWIIIGELLLVAVTGTIMGYVTRFRTVDEHLQYKLIPVGVWLWALFILIRVGCFYLASTLGANLAEATGLILLSFGTNRLAAIVIVRRRAEKILASAPRDVEENAS